MRIKRLKSHRRRLFEKEIERRVKEFAKMSKAVKKKANPFAAILN